MKRKPWAIVILALLHLLAPVGNLVLNSFYSGRTLAGQWQFWSQIIPKPLFIVYVIIPPLAGLFIYLCKRWTYWAYLGCLALIFVSNLFSFWSHMTVTTFLFLLFVIIGDLLVVAYFVVPSVQKVYFDPRLRWWEAAPRFNFDQDVLVNKAVSAFVRNISYGGLFMKFPGDLVEAQTVELSWDYEGVPYTVMGNVVYKTPVGHGVRFNHTPETSAAMKRLMNRLNKKGLIVRERLPGPEDTFIAWLKKLLHNKENLFPRV